MQKLVFDVIAPSGMIDGMIKTIREGLEENSFTKTLVMSYSIKYASSFYDPFRDVVNSAPKFKDRKEYQNGL